MKFLLIILCLFIQISHSTKLEILNAEPVIYLLQNVPFEIKCKVPPECNTYDIMFDLHRSTEGYVDEIEPKINASEPRILKFSYISSEIIPFGSHLVCRDKKNICTEDSRIIQILLQHPKPKITSIYVENWDWLTFSWTWKIDPKAVKNLYYPTVFSGWVADSRAPENPENYIPCILNFTSSVFTNINTNSCTISHPFDLARPDSVLALKVNGTNNAKEKVYSDPILIQLIDFVRPNKVTNLHYQSLGNHQAIFFGQPKRPRSIKYNVTVLCQKIQYFHDLVTPQQISDLEGSCTLTGLPPYTNCTAYVLAISSNMRGFWSPVASLNFTTPESVPISSPEICSSCFYIFNSSRINGSYYAVVYFKPMPVSKARGAIELYRMHIVDRISSRKLEVKGKPPDTQIIIGPLYVEHEYRVSVEARTKSGYNETLHLPVINIGRKNTSSLPIIESIQVVYRENSTKVSWKVIGVSTQFIIYFCMSSSYDPNKPRCWNSLDWVYVNGNMNMHTIHHGSFLNQNIKGNLGNFMIGVSAERNNLSLGIFWNNCTFSDIEAPLTPFVHVTNINEIDAELYIEEPSCNMNNGLAEHYIVQYCMMSFEGQCTGDWMEISIYSNKITLKDLRPNSKYKLSVRSISSSGIGSKEYKLQLHTTSALQKSLDAKYIAIIVCLLIIAILAIALCQIILRLYRKSKNKSKKIYNVDIQLPNGFSEVTNFEVASLDNNQIKTIEGILSPPDNNDFYNYKYDDYRENMLPLLNTVLVNGVKQSDTEQSFIDILPMNKKLQLSSDNHPSLGHHDQISSTKLTNVQGTPSHHTEATPVKLNIKNDDYILGKIIADDKNPDDEINEFKEEKKMSCDQLSRTDSNEFESSYLSGKTIEPIHMLDEIVNDENFPMGTDNISLIDNKEKLEDYPPIIKLKNDIDKYGGEKIQTSKNRVLPKISCGPVGRSIALSKPPIPCHSEIPENLEVLNETEKVDAKDYLPCIVDFNASSFESNSSPVKVMKEIENDLGLREITMPIDGNEGNLDVNKNFTEENYNSQTQNENEDEGFRLLPVFSTNK